MYSIKNSVLILSDLYHARYFRKFCQAWHSFTNLVYCIGGSCFQCFHMLSYLIDYFSVRYVYVMNCSLLFLVQTVVWCVIKGNSCALEDVAFSTSTAVTDMMTVGTSVMRGGVF